MEERKKRSTKSQKIVPVVNKKTHIGLNFTEDKKIRDKQIIKEELDLLKAKNKISSGVSRKRALISRKDKTKFSSNLIMKNEAAKEVLNQELNKLHQKSKGNYFEKREQRKQVEENKKNEATNFIRKLRKYKPKTRIKRLDEEYINKLEEQMMERRIKNVKNYSKYLKFRQK